MKLILIHRNICALLFAASICLAVWLGATFMLEAVYGFGAISIIFLILLARQSRLFNDAKLILDNRILTVPFALISISGRQMKKDTEETIVSTFGILIGNKIYRWGLDGVHGVRLHAAQIDQERIYLTFGTAERTMKIDLLHGMTEKQAVFDAAKKLWSETGVIVGVINW